MLEKITETLKRDDELFYLYQFPTYLYTEYGDVAHTIVDEHKDDGYMGLRQAWKLIDINDIEGKEVGEIGCNVGATSYEIMKMKPTTLYSFDHSSKAISICEEVRKFYCLKDWFPICRRFEKAGGWYHTIIWEDPHTAPDHEIWEILTSIYRRCEVVYFLECDNIYELIKDKDLEKLSENSWRLVL